MKNKNLKVKVIGIGDGINSIVEYLYQNNKRENIEFTVINLSSKSTDEPIVVDDKYFLTDAFGIEAECYDKPEAVTKYVLENIDNIRRFTTGSDIVILLSCFGDKTGTGIGATPLVAKILKESAVKAFSIITLPFDSFLEQTRKLATVAANELALYQKDCIVIDSQAEVESDDFPNDISIFDVDNYIRDKVVDKFYTLLADVFYNADAE